MENETSISQSLTLEQAKEKLERLLAEAESNAWEIGDLLNTVEKQGLAKTSSAGEVSAVGRDSCSRGTSSQPSSHPAAGAPLRDRRDPLE